MLATASAAWAEFLYFASFSIAGVASRLHDKGPLTHGCGACTVAGITLLRGCAWLASIAFAGFAFDSSGVFNSLRVYEKEGTLVAPKTL